jgi:tRNA-dihydrouridine synthase B
MNATTENKPMLANGMADVASQRKPLWIGDLLIDPPILQAPMAGYTNYAFRQIVREFGGTGLQATEMVNARGFVWLDEHDCEHPDRLWVVKDEARPLDVQIWDNDPETMAKVGKRLAGEYGVSVVDINFGCSRLKGVFGVFPNLLNIGIVDSWLCSSLEQSC